MSAMSRFLMRLSRGEEEAREQATLTWVGLRVGSGEGWRYMGEEEAREQATLSYVPRH